MKPSPLRRLLKPATAATPAGSPTDPAAPFTGSAAEQQAHTLLAAIDAGGIPLHPAKVNQIAAALGLPVSREEAVEATIARIRAAIARQTPAPEPQLCPDWARLHERPGRSAVLLSAV